MKLLQGFLERMFARIIIVAIIVVVAVVLQLLGF
jgi:hypothetical protein